MRKLKLWIRNYFGFSQREVNGFLWLITIMVLLTAAPFLFSRNYNSNQPISANPADQQLLDSLVAQLEKAPDTYNRSRKTIATVPLYRFNPNTLSLEQWQGFGLPKYLGQRILNYRSKVGDFTYRAELGKIYGMPDSVFQRLYPFIDLPETKPDNYSRKGIGSSRPHPAPGWENRPRERFVLAPFNINTADTAQLKQIRGIGRKLSARIVKYRDRLGGFYSLEQLREVYGLQPEVIDSLSKYTFVAKAHSPARINLNTATIEELRTHPYMTSNLARAIVAYREQHGRFESVEELKQIKIIKPEQYEKLKSYLGV
ncbi:helix-hairpin-helix domain-containing protein [Pontibacter sp. BT310]|uniref:Helix-hairpin-helix domain-containing protein n=1 Tax=Pontibacter populi TaxID=890055 RepID=A0ABS6X8X2_9BACT|nr:MULTISPECIES: helix-hairpin-helix domain-containing protein [Pontibacter]MBJ6117110.1 helix-hairpin-helix domain-containing protein [Pontibacter sp. BT310]MBR0569534.1 helix-hairpin-helix domain-containing protein [Microvirga sp. STS03]MBW3363963.1 helix-hairpin-helix domain-containing protein [Pontibacter populi]